MNLKLSDKMTNAMRDEASRQFNSQMWVKWLEPAPHCRLCNGVGRHGFRFIERGRRVYPQAIPCACLRPRPGKRPRVPLLAILFGKKLYGYDRTASGPTTVAVMRKWFGKFYVTGIKYGVQPKPVGGK